MKTEAQKQYIYPQEYIPFRHDHNNGLPGSETSFAINLTGMAAALGAVALLKASGSSCPGLAVLALFVAVLAVSVWGLEFLFRRQGSLFSKIRVRRRLSWPRLGYKLLALMFVWGLIAFLYWLFPIYQDSLFRDYFRVLKSIWWLLVLIAVFYFAGEDKISERPKDVYWQLGRWLCGHREDADKGELTELFRGWGVKFFYLALMFPYFEQRLDWFMKADFGRMSDYPYNVFIYLNELIFLIDLSFAAAGYMMTFRLFNTQIRSSEPTLVGWLAAVMCYWPFWGDLIGRYYLAYGTGTTWVQVFENTGIWFILWMSMILILELVYSLATVALGLRFSNLTYRGLVTGGPYRYTKHPAYVFKNISWWLVSMPFMVWGANWQLALRGCILLFGVNILYYIRAKTEENHLSHYPEYVEYALKMNEKSIFAPLAKVLPFLRYKAPGK